MVLYETIYKNGGLTEPLSRVLKGMTDQLRVGVLIVFNKSMSAFFLRFILPHYSMTPSFTMCPLWTMSSKNSVPSCMYGNTYWKKPLSTALVLDPWADYNIISSLGVSSFHLSLSHKVKYRSRIPSLTISFFWKLEVDLCRRTPLRWLVLTMNCFCGPLAERGVLRWRSVKLLAALADVQRKVTLWQRKKKTFDLCINVCGWL